MMNFRFPTVLAIAAMSFASLRATGFSNSPGDLPPGAASQFQITEKTQVPGHTLKPGNYSIVVVDRLSDRMVLRITSDAGKEESTFLAVSPTTTFPSQAAPGPVDMRTQGGHVAALRGFIFANGTRTEFVYLKAEAVPLAKANDTTLVAIDPASEGRPDKDNLSPTDRQLVALWMLTPTVIGKTPAMEAQRYQLAADSKPVAPQNWSLPSGRASRPLMATNSVPPPDRVANPVTVLPHTASSQPMVLLVGMLSVLAATLLGWRRRIGAHAR